MIDSVEIVALSDLRPHPRNYQTHPMDQLLHIAESIRAHGVYRNIVIARDNTILAGHGVVEACKLVPLTEVPVVRLPLAPDDPRALQVLVGDNEIGNLAERDDRLLSEVLKTIREEDENLLLGTGFDDAMLTNLVFVTRPASEIQSPDEAAEWAGMPDYDGEKRLPPKLVVSFRDEADRLSLLERLGLDTKQLSGKMKDTWSMWWPPKQALDLTAVRFEGQDDADSL